MHLVEQHQMFSKEILWWNADAMTLMWKGRPVVDTDYISITVLFQRFFQMPKIAPNVVAQSVETCAFSKRQRWPLREWLTGLKWDGKSRIESLFGKYVVSDLPADYLREVSRRFMIGAVARRLMDYSKFDQMTILVGEQGIKKSSFWKTLFGWENVAGIIGDQKDKDTRMRTSS